MQSTLKNESLKEQVKSVLHVHVSVSQTSSLKYCLFDVAKKETTRNCLTLTSVPVALQIAGFVIFSNYYLKLRRTAFMNCVYLVQYSVFW